MKKILMGIVVAAMCAFTGFTEETVGFAEDAGAAVPVTEELDTPADEEIGIQCEFLGKYVVNSLISRSSNTVTCISEVDCTDDPTVSKIELKQHLQRFSAPNWIVYKTKSQDYYTNEEIEYENAYKVSSGYSYRVVTQVRIYCADGPHDFAVASNIV